MKFTGGSVITAEERQLVAWRNAIPVLSLLLGRSIELIVVIAAMADCCHCRLHPTPPALLQVALSRTAAWWPSQYGPTLRLTHRRTPDFNAPLRTMSRCCVVATHVRTNAGTQPMLRPSCRCSGSGARCRCAASWRSMQPMLRLPSRRLISVSL